MNSGKMTSANSKSWFYIIIGMVLGGMISAMSYHFLSATPSFTSSVIPSVIPSVMTKEQLNQKQPLYWVAPMDDNYRKDAPGKSPMGMDLVPVYKDTAVGAEQALGIIRISPEVINNLGVRTVAATYKHLDNQITTVAYVTYDEDKLVHIHPRVQGWIDKLYLTTLGASVTKGQPLYDLYSPALVNAQEELLLALDRGNKRLITAAENRLVALQLPLTAITQLKQSKQVQQNITFYAPQSGVIEHLNIREGFFVKPGSTLMSIGDLSQVWLEAQVFERQAAQVKKHNPVTMRLDYLPGKTWSGNVDYVYPTLDANSRTVKVRVRVNNSNGDFKPNMFAQIVIHTASDKPSLLIPKQALIRTGRQDRVVLALGDGRFKSIAVQVGRFGTEQVEILSGLTDGEQVVSSAQFLLDSESSKSSDFTRMHSPSSMQKNNSATVMGTINALMPEHGMINISRQAIEKWRRPAARLDFILAEGLTFTDLHQGMTVNFTFERIGDEFIISKITPLIAADDNSHSASPEKSVVDHLMHK